MNRNRIMTTIGILFSCTLVFIGFFIMQELLRQKQEKVLSQTGTIPAIKVDWEETKTFQQTEVLKEEKNSQKIELSQEELVQILKSIQSKTDEEPHEPFGQQLSITGQVLRAKVTSYLPEENFLSLNVKELLTSYAKSFSLETDSAVKKEETMIYLNIIDSEIYIIMQTDSTKISQIDGTRKTKEFNNTLDLYLSTELK